MSMVAGSWKKVRNTGRNGEAENHLGCQSIVKHEDGVGWGGILEEFSKPRP